MKTIKIDGSFGEGGGQILRTALSLSCITGSTLHLSNIRKGRKKPGLMPQHMTCINAASEITNARVSGNDKGSSELTFDPGKIKSGKYFFDIITAGSSSLVMQTLIPPLVFAGGDSLITIKGGTHVPFSPTYHYVAEVFMPTLNLLGIRVEPQIIKCGYYPEGGGEVLFKIIPAAQIKSLNLSGRRELLSLHGYSCVSRLPMSIAERQRAAAINALPVSADIRTSECPSSGKGTFIFLKAEYENSLAGFSSLGKLGKPAERVGKEAAEEFKDFHASTACIDPHLADQIVIYLSLARGNSSFTTSRITKHLITNLWVIEKFLNITYQIEGDLNSGGRVSLTPSE
jgi:RNA 3'-terminal phosphate cyclase (ATP)